MELNEGSDSFQGAEAVGDVEVKKVEPLFGKYPHIGLPRARGQGT